jgi:hypothetical protein
VNWYVTFDVRL